MKIISQYVHIYTCAILIFLPTRGTTLHDSSSHRREPRRWYVQDCCGLSYRHDLLASQLHSTPGSSKGALLQPPHADGKGLLYNKGTGRVAGRVLYRHFFPQLLPWVQSQFKPNLLLAGRFGDVQQQCEHPHQLPSSPHGSETTVTTGMRRSSRAVNGRAPRLGRVCTLCSGSGPPTE